jgi:hypothetical protein
MGADCFRPSHAGLQAEEGDFMRAFLGILVVLAIGLVGVGIYRNWFEFTAAKSDDDKHASVKLDVNREKMGDDVKAAKVKAHEFAKSAKEELQELGGKAKEKSHDLGTAVKEEAQAAKEKAREVGSAVKDRLAKATPEETVRGKVVKIDESGHSFDLTTSDKKQVSVQVDSSSKLTLKGSDLQLQDLHNGDDVTVTYHAKEGKNVATSIKAERP